MTPQEYEQIINESRLAQYRLQRESALALERMIAELALEIRDRIASIPVGIGGARYESDVQAQIDAVMATFASRYQSVLDPAMVEAAQNAIDRENEVLGSAFGGSSFDAIQAAYSIHYPNGLNLTDSIYNLGIEARRGLTDTLAKALAQGTSVDGLAKQLMDALQQPGVDNLRYRAQRIARTEINRSYREGHISRVTDPETGKLREGIKAIGWRLSSSHPKPDICDWWASDDSDGLGPGNYLPGNLPSGHANCTCFTVSILTDIPGQFAPNEPHPDAVPPGQLKYYGIEP